MRRPIQAWIKTPFFSLIIVLTIASSSSAQNQKGSAKYKQLPPMGLEIDQEVSDELTRKVSDIRRACEVLGSRSVNNQPHTAKAKTADIEVLARAVEFAVKDRLFFKPAEFDRARTLLDLANVRLEKAGNGKNGLDLIGYDRKATDARQLLVGGFVSDIDDSVQPYGVILPAGFDLAKAPYRVDVWLHGRGDTKTELQFLTERLSKEGYYSPVDTIVLHPFGRHCNAFKFAGETDVYEAIEHLRSIVPIDDDRTSIRGFSMGGAGCWHMAVHNPSRWFAANPGAGFVDTIVYQRWQDESPFPIGDLRKRLLNWYDVLPWSSNFQNTSLVAYSGEVDKQRQAAERVVSDLAKKSIRVTHVIGSKMGHKIDEVSQDRIDDLLSELAQQALAKSPLPQDVDFTTYTLRYHQCDWLSVEGLQQHFTAGHVKGRWTAKDRVELTTDGVTELAIELDSAKTSSLNVQIDDQSLVVPLRIVDGTAVGRIRLASKWQAVQDGDASADQLRKRPGLQGPIDDAFCSRFVFVVPSRPASHGSVQRFINREMNFAMERWRTIMRGDVRIIQDTEVTQQHVEDCNLICFGDFASNRYLAKIASGLPIQWSKEALTVGTKSFDPVKSAASFIYPNPANPNRYVVANSGMTFRQFSNVSNSRQIAMLADWAIFDTSSKSDQIFAGDIRDEGFFSEAWQVQ